MLGFNLTAGSRFSVFMEMNGSVEWIWQVMGQRYNTSLWRTVVCNCWPVHYMWRCEPVCSPEKYGHTSRCTSSSSKIFQHLQIRLILLSHLLICIFLFFRRCPGGGVTRPFLQEAAAVLRAVWFPGLRCRPEGKGDQTCGAERAGRECGHQQRSPHRASVPRGYKDGRREGGGKKNKSKCWGVFFFLQSKHNQTIAIIQAKTVTKSGCGGRANRSIAKPREIQGARNIFLQMNQSSSSATPRGCTHGTGRDELRKRRKQGRKRERRQVGMRVSLWGAPEILKRADNNRKERAVKDEGDRHDYDYLYCLHRKLLRLGPR